MASKGAKYTLEVLLKARDALSRELNKPIARLGQLEKQAKQTLKAVKAVEAVHKRAGAGSAKAKAPAATVAVRHADAARALRLEREHTRLATDRLRLRREESRLLKEETRLHERRERAARAPAPAQPAPRDTRRSFPRPGAWMRDSDRPPRWRDDVEPTTPHAPRGRRRGALHAVERAGQRVGRARDVAYDFTDAYGQARDSLSRYTDPAAELMRARSRLGTLGLNPDEAARADEAIKKTVAAVPGARLSEVTQAFAELYEVFASVDDTARNIGRAAQYSFAMKTIHGDLYSPEQLTTQTKAAYKFVDLIGLTRPDAWGQVDNARIDAYHDTLMQVLSATGGEVNPREMLQAAKIGGTSLMGMSRAGLGHIASLASDVGGSRAGNMQRSMLQSFVGGKLFEKHVNALDEFGMVDRSKVRKLKGGKMDLQPGAIRYADTISIDPLILIDKLAEGMRGKGVDTTSEREVINAAARLSPNTLTQNMIAQSIIRRDEMTRFDELIAKAEALDRMFGRAKDSPLGKIEDAKAKGENVRATLGGPMLEAGGSLSEHLSRFYAGLQSFAERSPVMSSALAGIGSLGGAALSAGEGVGTLAGLLRDLRGGDGGGGAGGRGAGGGGILGTGIGTGHALSGGGYLGWRLLKWGVPRLGLPGLIAGGAAGSLYAIHQQYEHDTAKRREAQGAAAASFEQLQGTRTQAGGVLPPDVAARAAREAFPGVGRANLLNTLDLKTYGTAGYPGMMARPQFDRTQMLAGEFARQGPTLKFSEVMREFINDVRGGVTRGEIRQPAANQLLEVARAAFPESFKAAAEGAAEGLTKVNDPASRTAEAFLRLYSPADRLGPGLSQAQSAAVTFAARVNALDIRTSFPFPPPSNTSGGVTTGRHGVPGSPLGGLFNPPRSAIGSVVESDGLVSAHKGNVITPAKLSRRAPGDWLDTLTPELAAPGYTDFEAGGAVHNYTLNISVPPGSRAANYPEAFARLVMQKLDALQSENAALRAEVERRTDPRRIERHIKHRMETEGERA